MGILLIHVSECHISEHVELTRTVHAVSESKNIGLYKRGGV